MSYNFDFTSVPTASATSYLKPYTINKDVEIDGTEIKEGTSTQGTNWKCLKITFKNGEGSYTESIFWPTDGDEKRKEYDQANGGKRLAPSSLENTKAMIVAVIKAFNPDKFNKFVEMSAKFKSFDDVMTAFAAIIKGAKGNKTSMKLVGKVKDNKVYAVLPKPLGIYQDKNTHEWITFPIAMFGDNLTFTAYEEQQRQKYLNSKKTQMDESPVADSFGVAPTESDIDFDSLV